MKNHIKTISLGFAAALLLTCSAIAQSGANGKFDIINISKGNTVVGFYTNDGDGWSTNWLDAQLAPGEESSAAFDADTGSCDQTLQVGWLSESGGEVMDEPININICKASTVYLDDNEIYFE